MRTHSLRVIVVDDQREVRETLGESLCAYGIDVALAADAGEAFAFARDGRYDVMLADVVLIGSRGLELRTTLRETRPKMKVILMTGHTDLFDEIVASGALALIEPFLHCHVACNSRRRGSRSRA